MSQHLWGRKLSWTFGRKLFKTLFTKKVWVQRPSERGWDDLPFFTLCTFSKTIGAFHGLKHYFLESAVDEIQGSQSVFDFYETPFSCYTSRTDSLTHPV